MDSCRLGAVGSSGNSQAQIGKMYTLMAELAGRQAGSLVFAGVDVVARHSGVRTQKAGYSAPASIGDL